MARIELCHLPFICKDSNVKIYAFIVIRRYLCISLLDLLDKKKNRQNLPFVFSVNYVKSPVHFYHMLSVSYSVG